MQTHKRIWQYFRSHRSARVALGYGCALLALAATFLNGGIGGLAFAQSTSTCAKGDLAYTVKSGDTLSRIAERYNMDWHKLATYNHLANPNRIYRNQTICVPGSAAKQSGQPTKGTFNPYPHGQCTWWADQRYHQLHGIYVPWLYNSDAWQWTTRARQYHWHVSSSPTVGAIMDLQPWVQGAYDYGHVAVVEQILSNGDVIASSMNWGDDPSDVTYAEFSPGSGVTFITY